MPLCEMCGSEHPRLRAVSVEGTRLMLCDRCARFGEAIQPSPARRTPRPMTPRGRGPPRAEESDYDLARDYPERIRGAREARGWKREELARKINEKLSVVEKLEKGRMRPPDTLVSKLERTLGVKLRERVEAGEASRHTEMRPLTLGDLIRKED